MKYLLLIVILSFSFNGVHLFEQQIAERTIKGIVVDESNEPVIFASVFVKNLNLGILTDLEGRFQLSIPDSCKVLVFTYSGYSTQEVNIEGKDSILVVMKSGVVLDEVVVKSFKIPVMEHDNTTQGEIKTAEQIRNLPTKSINKIAATTAGLSSIDGGAVSIRGSRIDATSYYTDGIRASKGSAVTSFEYLSAPPEMSTTTTDPHPESNDSYSSGQLTAGEINDFGKWILWNDKSQQELTEYRNVWNIYPSRRYMVIVQNDAGIPIVGQTMYLLDKKNNIVWTAKTDNTGKAELWSNMFEETYKDGDRFSITTKMNDREYNIHNALRFEKGVNHLTIKSECNLSNVVDAVFVVDATGSMGDELNYLQEELTDVMQKVKDNYQDLTLNLGSVFYRDHGDEYVTRTSELSSDISKTIHFIQKQSAGGGGDEPEAIDEALEIAVRSMNWSSDARTKLLFVVMDASPHKGVENLNRIRDITIDAAKEGIKIIPLTASGIDKSTEYLMRSLALCTNGTYVFLTDHSGIGNPHLQPTTDKYDVGKLNDLIIRLFDQYISVVSCSKDDEQTNLVMPDTLEIQSGQLFVTDTMQDLVITDIKHETEKMNCTYYPNPTTGLLNIDVKGKIQELFLCDVSGKLMQRFEMNGEDRLQVDISPYPIGTYRIMYFENINVPRSGSIVLVR